MAPHFATIWAGTIANYRRLNSATFRGHRRRLNDRAAILSGALLRPEAAPDPTAQGETDHEPEPVATAA